MERILKIGLEHGYNGQLINESIALIIEFSTSETLHWGSVD